MHRHCNTTGVRVDYRSRKWHLYLKMLEIGFTPDTHHFLGISHLTIIVAKVIDRDSRLQISVEKGSP